MLLAIAVPRSLKVNFPDAISGGLAFVATSLGLTLVVQIGNNNLSFADAVIGLMMMDAISTIAFW